MSRILVIDDDKDILELVEIILLRNGFEILISPKGEETLDNVENFAPQVILLDVFLAGVNGIDICRELKSNAKTAHIPVIMYSAHTNKNAIMQQRNANDFLAKPFDIRNLIDKIEFQLKNSN